MKALQKGRVHKVPGILGLSSCFRMPLVILEYLWPYLELWVPGSSTYMVAVPILWGVGEEGGGKSFH